MMKRVHAIKGFWLGLFFMVLIFTGFSSYKNSGLSSSGAPNIDMYLDSIQTGPITQNQLLSAKKLVVISNGISYGVKSFDIGSIPNGGAGRYAHCIGASISPSVKSVFQDVKPKDLIIVGNLKLFNLEKFMNDPHAKPLWTVVAASK